MILVIDNYDSFTYNLVQYLAEVSNEAHPLKVVRNDAVSLDEIAAMRPSHIVISPGPCTPNEAGISMAVAKHFAGTLPILGVCLGHQAIGQAFGAEVVRAKQVVHGKTSRINHSGEGIFQEVENPCVATRYHSLVVKEKSLPECLEVIARSEGRDGQEQPEIMGLRHREHPTLLGLQFHPESILTSAGKKLLKNFLEIRV